MHLDLESIYTRKPGKPIIVTPQTSDPTSPYNWAGTVWEGSASSTFSATKDDGSWSVRGTADWAHSTEGTTGHIIHERNGVFALHGGDDRPRHHHTDDSRLEIAH